MLNKRVGNIRRLITRHGFQYHLTLLAIFLLVLFLFMADHERVVRAAPISETLWGISQACDFEIENPQNSIEASLENFDDHEASCTGEFAADQKAWSITAFQPTSLAIINSIKLEVRFYVTNLQDDRIRLEVFDGDQWKILQDYTGAMKKPPSTMETLGYDLLDILDSQAKINQAAFRIIGTKTLGSTDVITIVLDGVRLVVNGVNEPTKTPTPTLLSSATPTLTPTSQLISPSPVISVTATPLELSPSPEFTASPTESFGTESLWAIDQECGYEIIDPTMSLDQQFNDQVASCTGQFAGDQKAWNFTPFQSGSFSQFNRVRLEVRFSVTGIVSDHLNLELSDGNQWFVLHQFNGNGESAPLGLETMLYDVSEILNSLDKVNLVSARFVGELASDQPDTLTISLDGIRLVIMSEPSITATPTIADTPTPSPSPPSYQTTITTTLSPTPVEQLRALPTPEIPPYLAAAPSIPGDPHGNNSGMTDSCSACHTSHAAAGIELRRNWPEESVCFSCHASAGVGTNIEPSFSSYTNTQTGIFKHDIGMTTGVHRANQSNGGDYGGGNRHIECEDCHEPHYAARGETNPPMLQAEMTGVSGVEPVWVGAGAPESFAFLAEAKREHQVCFKCHSSFTALPSYTPDGWDGSSFVTNGLPKLTSTDPLQVPDHRDLATAFNPNLASFHPVVTLGRNQNMQATTFVSGWSQASMVYCTDCHQNANSATQGYGPHGSPLLHILNGQANYSTVTLNKSPVVSDQEVCFLCHSYQAYVTGDIEASNFRAHKKHMKEDWGVTCYTCHNSHGSEQLHLINFDASVMTFLNGTDSQTAWYETGNGGGGCWLVCHGKDHDPIEYGPG